MLIDIAQCEELFHTATGTAFADITIAGRRETSPIRSKRFRAFLRRMISLQGHRRIATYARRHNVKPGITPRAGPALP
jgi:hypothetical protein